MLLRLITCGCLMLVAASGVAVANPPRPKDGPLGM
jgi:hypothetical protein